MCSHRTGNVLRGKLQCYTIASNCMACAIYTHRPLIMSHAGSKTLDVMRAIRSKIAGRSYAAGDRLPSIRKLATAMGVSPSTVVDAYDRLAAEGVVCARRGSGFFISATALPHLSLVEADPKRDHIVDPFWVSRQSLDANPQMIKPGCGWLPSDWMPADALRRACRSLARADESVLTEYARTRGPFAMRRLLFSGFAEEGLNMSVDQILLTGSGTQAIDLICRLLLRPSDTVLVDDPCYFNFRAL